MSVHFIVGILVLNLEAVFLVFWGVVHIIMRQIPGRMIILEWAHIFEEQVEKSSEQSPYDAMFFLLFKPMYIYFPNMELEELNCTINIPTIA